MKDIKDSKEIIDFQDINGIKDFNFKSFIKFKVNNFQNRVLFQFNSTLGYITVHTNPNKHNLFYILLKQHIYFHMLQFTLALRIFLRDLNNQLNGQFHFLK